MKNNFTIDDLTKIVPPPEKPRDSLMPSKFDGFISELNVKLPTDWITLGKVYGSGTFREAKKAMSYIWIYNPLSQGFVKKMAEICDEEREDESFCERFAVFPEGDGLFPLGQDDCDHWYWYVTSGDPEKWPILVSDKGYESRTFQLGIIPFLVNLLSGAISIWNPGHNPFPNGVLFSHDEPT